MRSPLNRRACLRRSNRPSSQGGRQLPHFRFRKRPNRCWKNRSESRRPSSTRARHRTPPPRAAASRSSPELPSPPLAAAVPTEQSARARSLRPGARPAVPKMPDFGAAAPDENRITPATTPSSPPAPVAATSPSPRPQPINSRTDVMDIFAVEAAVAHAMRLTDAPQAPAPKPPTADKPHPSDDNHELNAWMSALHTVQTEGVQPGFGFGDLPEARAAADCAIDGQPRLESSARGRGVLRSCRRTTFGRARFRGRYRRRERELGCIGCVATAPVGALGIGRSSPARRRCRRGGLLAALRASERVIVR